MKNSSTETFKHGIANAVLAEVALNKKYYEISKKKN